MKKILFCFLTLAFLSIGCNKDDDSDGLTLRHDGDNSSAPLLDANVYQMASRFTSTVINPFRGQKLEEVEFYLMEEPSTCTVIIYGEGTSTEPGVQLYIQDITSSINGNSWNTHVLSNPVELLGDDIWICLEVTHNQSIRTVGCDPGPAVANGDWVFAQSSGQWETLRSFTGGLVDINWNIRGRVSAE